MLLVTIVGGILFFLVEKRWVFSLIFGLGTIVAGTLVVWLQQPRWKNVALILLSVFASLAIAEIICLLNNTTEEHYTGEFTTSYYRDDVELGYGANPGKFSIQKHQGDQLIYSQEYTITSQGFRETPSKKHKKACNVVFFGGSVTFGEGVSDHETMPYFFAKEGNGKFNVYNLGFHGYGPHQMLRILETDRLKTIVDGSVHLVIYQGIEAHVDRVAGNTSWDFYGPRYTLMPNGSVSHTGAFHGELYKFFYNLVQHSALYNFIQQHVVQLQAFNLKNIPLYLGVLEQSRRVIELKIHAPFYVLFWDKGSDDILTDQIVQKLEDNHFQFIKISQIIPDIQVNRESYILSPHDPHPNATAHHLIGKHLAEALKDSPCDTLKLN